MEPLKIIDVINKNNKLSLKKPSHLY